MYGRTEFTYDTLLYLVWVWVVSILGFDYNDFVCW